MTDDGDQPDRTRVPLGRHAAMATATHAWVEHQRLDGRVAGIVAPSGARSATVMVVKTPDGVDARTIVDQVAHTA